MVFAGEVVEVESLFGVLEGSLTPGNPDVLAVGVSEVDHELLELAGVAERADDVA